MECYSGGAIAAAVIGTFLSTLVLVALAHFLWKRNREKKIPLSKLEVIETEIDKKGYDNIGFTSEDEKLRAKSIIGENSQLEKVHHDLHNGRGIQTELSHKYSVSLKGRDFTGLGFSVAGNLKEGIYVKDILQRGPAKDSNKIQHGDRILGLSVSFEEIVLEDALTLLSYASPYEVTLDLIRGQQQSQQRSQRSPSDTPDRITHPSYKNQSAVDQRKLDKEVLKKSEDPGLAKRPHPVSTSVQSVMVSSNEKRRSSPVVIRIEEDEGLKLRTPPDVVDGTKMAEVNIEYRKSPEPSTNNKELIEAISPKITNFQEKPSVIACSKIPDEVLHHMTEITQKQAENQRILPSSEEILLEEIPQEGKSDSEKSKFKFGIRVFPDFNFGRRSSSPALEHNEIKNGEKEVEKKIKKEKNTSTASLPVSKENVETKVNNVVAVEVTMSEKPIEKSDDIGKDRPSSADSTNSKGDKKFHMPIRIFRHSKQYTLEREEEDPQGRQTPIDEEDFKIRQIHDTQEPIREVNLQNPPLDETPDKEKENKVEEKGFVSKGIQSLRDFKEKVTQKLSAQDTTTSSDKDEEDATQQKSPRKGRKKSSKKMKLSSDDPKSGEKPKKIKEKSSKKIQKIENESGNSESEEFENSGSGKRKKSNKIKEKVGGIGIEEEMTNDAAHPLKLTINELHHTMSSDDSSENDDEKHTKKPKRSTKRKAPIPPSSVVQKTLITTAAEVATVHIKPPEIVEATVKSKILQIESKTPENGRRSASFGDLSSPHAQTHKISLSDRATSLDFQAESPPTNHITGTVHMEDLSRDSDSLVHQMKSKETDSMTSSSTSSSETLKDTLDTPTTNHPQSTNPQNPPITPPITMDYLIILPTNETRLYDGDETNLPSIFVSNPTHHQPTPTTISVSTNHTEVVISTSGTTVLDKSDVEALATEAVNEIMERVKRMDEAELRSRKPSRIPVLRSNSQTLQNEEEPKKPKLLRDDSKTRLMQMVADANEIKISPLTPSNRNSHHGDGKSPKGSEENRTIEISSKELDGIMMSHSEFLAKQSSASAQLQRIKLVETPPPKDSSFDNWIYVDQKLQSCSPIHSSEPSASSGHDDDDDPNVSRNLSPTTFKMETTYDTSALKVTTTTPSKEDTKVFSTTMTLPQKTITQILITPEDGRRGREIHSQVLQKELPALEPIRK